MATSPDGSLFLLPTTRLEMKDVRARSMIVGLLLCPTAIFLLGVFLATDDPLFGLLGLTAGGAALLWGMRLVVSGARLPAIPNDRSLSDIIRRYRALRPLRAASFDAANALIPQLSDEELRFASVLPDHSEEARTAATAELHARGVDRRAKVPVIPSFLPPHERERTQKLILTTSGGIRTACYMLLRPLRPVFWTLLPVWLLLKILGPEASDVAQEAGFENLRAGAEWILQPIAGLIILVTGWTETVLFFLANGRRHPARILFLRKFNSAGLQRSYRNLTRELRPCGHIFGLSDRFLRDSWVRWSFRTENLGIILLKLAFILPLVLLLRFVDSVRFGPPTIRRAGDYRKFCRHLRERRWLNFRSCYLDGGLYIRTSDEWWQIVALTLLVSSDVIILDLSEPTDAIRWEMRTISHFQLWHRVVVVCREDRVAEMEALAKDFELPQVWFYGRKGRLKNHQGFLDAVLTAIHSSVAQRWTAAPVENVDRASADGATAILRTAAPTRHEDRPKMEGLRLSAGTLTLAAAGLIGLGVFGGVALSPGGGGDTGNASASTSAGQNPLLEDTTAEEPQIEEVRQQLRQEPNDDQGWFNLGVLLRGTERFPEAAEAFRRAMELRPENADYIAYLAEALVLQSQGNPPPEAERLFRRAVALDLTHPLSRYYLALLRDVRGDHRGAIDELLALLRDAPPGAAWEPQVREAAIQIAEYNRIDISSRLRPQQ